MICISIDLVLDTIPHFFSTSLNIKKPSCRASFIFTLNLSVLVYLSIPGLTGLVDFSLDQLSAKLAGRILEYIVTTTTDPPSVKEIYQEAEMSLPKAVCFPGFDCLKSLKVWRKLPAKAFLEIENPVFLQYTAFS